MGTSTRNSLAEQLMDTKAIKQALQLPAIAEWNKDRKFMGAEQAKEIGAVLVGQVHKHLVNAKIGYLFREQLFRGGKQTHSIASKAGGKIGYYSKLDFVVEINWTMWSTMTPEQRVACVDHALCHFGIEQTENGNRCILLPHDLEEFNSIVSRWGLWQADIARMHKVMTNQLGLFTEQTAPSTLADDSE